MIPIQFFIIGKKHGLDIVFQLALGIVMKGQQARQILILHVADAVCGGNMRNDFFSIQRHQRRELTFSFQHRSSDQRFLK
ncbi:MAG: hypothetical protein IKH57_21740 [Clostridia bacterium]|nr:hypothetical protein [Clostridia bacterium]